MSGPVYLVIPATCAVRAVVVSLQNIENSTTEYAQCGAVYPGVLGSLPVKLRIPGLAAPLRPVHGARRHAASFEQLILTENEVTL